MSYRLLVLPELDSMRPELLKKIRDLVAAGGTILGPPPSRSPSLKDYPQCDARVKQLAAELWANQELPSPGTSSTFHASRFTFRVLQSTELQPVLDELGIAPDFTGADPKQILWTHRSSKEARFTLSAIKGSKRPLSRRSSA